MKKKLLISAMALTLLLASCSQSDASPISAPTDTLKPTPTSTPVPTLKPTSTSTPAPTFAAPDNTVQVDMFRLIPSGFLSAAYYDVNRIRDYPDLKSVFEAGPNGILLWGMPDDVDASLTLVLRSTVSADSPGITIAAVTIQRGNFDREAIPEDIPEDLAGVIRVITIAASQIRSGNFDRESMPEYIPEDLAGVSFQDYQGVEITVIEVAQDLEYASAFIDEATWVFGPEAGVKAVLDTAKDLTTPPLADLGAALPHVFFAMVGSMCEYEACTAQVLIGLAKGPEGTLSTIQLHQFENAAMAADALPAIRTQQEGGGFSMGSVDIIGDTITQEGRFIKVDGTLPMEDLSRMFESGSNNTPEPTPSNEMGEENRVQGVSVAPYSGPIPTSYYFSLFGFAPLETILITITYVPTGESVYQATIFADAEGMAQLTVTSEDSDPEGTYRLDAKGDEGSSAWAQVLVLSPSPTAVKKVSIIPNPMTLVSNSDCTKSNWQFAYTRSFQRVDANSSYTLTASNGYNATENMDWLTIGQSHTSDVEVDFDGGYAANYNYQIQYVGNDGSSATLIWNCETGEVFQSSWNPAD
ncbi:MAG: hypothetical protein KAI06_00410 [Anaerolineales bacterium]|nr:hypothetical protein [Anaerolineales bacterium]